MKIFEEYLKRHKIKSNLIYHNKKNNLLFKKQKDYLILDFYWKEYKDKPGKYVFNFYSPIKNNLKNKNSEECFVSWNDYEGYILEFIKAIKQDCDLVYEIDDVRISYLKIFSIVYGKSIPRNKSSKLKFIEDLKGENLNIWNNEFSEYLENYSYWAGKLW